ncbi:beta-hydroxyacyl-ACP dehydratase [Serratia marcescens]|nr:beta-hydroxyacyl-ACP dehydratase [Serratia marcescens]MBH2865983.1 beta-hydroxyacyl-ACP dehydratase [Serratia marcescens]
MTDYADPVLPHRYPFLFIERIISTPEEHADGLLRALMCISVSGGIHCDRFPFTFPSVILIEALAQAVGMLIALQHTDKCENMHGMLAGVRMARFRGAARPGDRLHLTVRLLRRRSSLVFLSGEVALKGQCLCKTTFSCAIQNNEM